MLADSVRLALPAEAGAIAAVQRRNWRQVLPAELASGALASVGPEQMAASWEAAILRPPLAQYRVLVALGNEPGPSAEPAEDPAPRVVGFAALHPSDDPDAEAPADALVAEFAVDPVAQRHGHGSRLLNACIDTLRADGFTRATWWVQASNDVLRTFLAEAGWEPDGAHAEVAMAEGGPRLKLVRLHTAIE